MAIKGKAIGRPIVDYGGTSNALQEAIITQLAKFGINYFDGNSRKPEYPYVVIGEELTSSNNTKTSRGYYHNVTLNLWSDEAGSLEVKGLTNIIVDMLTTEPFPMPKGHVLRYQRLDHFRVIPADNSATNIARSTIYLDFKTEDFTRCFN